ncbi:beta-barrel fold lipoprotein [Dyadobacter psychrotolerans]|uniref:Uncharacterized protein n=1 Tax=Dyadobacter psychrotolerans TaxID=2541721 RepID=A0A4R5D8H1_9BACT|nr:hypothetical protein [Dyadobacter psychrotolerans]TDE09776.1 hypothetical protein E0F88_29745 [Dyadobacter psychrotolerans]
MRKYLLMLSAWILFFSCSDDSKTVTPEPGSIFKVEYIQSGKYEDYKKEIGFSEPLVYEGTAVETGLIVNDVALTDGKYVFVTSKNLELLKVTFNTEPKEGSGEMAEFVINVYRDGKRIDNKSFKVAGSGVMKHSWEYKSK